MTITKPEISALLSEVLHGHFPCIVPPGGDLWTARVSASTGDLRVRVERNSNSSLPELDADVAGHVDVSLSSELVEAEDGFTWDEIETACWNLHVENSVDRWAESIVEQIASPESALAP